MGFTKRILRSIVCAVTISQTLILLANNSSNVLFSSDSPRRNFFAEREYDPDLARVLPGSVPVVCTFLFWQLLILFSFSCQFDLAFGAFLAPFAVEVGRWEGHGAGVLLLAMVPRL